MEKVTDNLKKAYKIMQKIMKKPKGKEDLSKK